MYTSRHFFEERVSKPLPVHVNKPQHPLQYLVTILTRTLIFTKPGLKDIS